MVTIIKKGTGKRRLAELFKRVSELPETKLLNAKQFCGTVKFTSDTMDIQKRSRDEWS